MRPISRALRAAAFAAVLLANASDASSGARAPASSEKPAAEPTARNWSVPPDFEALRAEFAARADFAELCEAERPLTAAFEALQSARWSDLLALTGKWTEQCPVDIEAHTLRAVALGESGRAADAEAHEMWARGLFEAVLATGNGKTPETAYRVIAEFEEYAMLRLFRYAPERQAIAPNGVDAMTVLADGEAQVIYFEPATHSAAHVAKLDGRRANR